MTSVGLLSSDRLAGAAGASVALRLARSGPAVLILLRDPDRLPASVPAPPPTPAAARLASAIRRKGHPAAASWRLIRSSVTTTEEAAELIDWCVGLSVPVVLAPLVAQIESVRSILERCERVIVASDDDVGEAVSSYLAAQVGPPADGVLSLPPAGAGAILAHAGIGAPPHWIEAIDGAIHRSRFGDGAERPAAGGGAE